ncbi:uncharacterized protein LOC107801756 [Nicotiana tabacum]|uniref:Uncharacterized protein LOC107801756 n=2 Tax=Nicotiana TaxID=4085 RepID=A0A1S4AV67_TOBAC|nr:PREDICTED: uncharacterized protein LOC104223403 [Nicotiana sylvestris]XP_016480627.1 PREDICTED: uncharacterized protein LOC107801756 [Nicotiana tabacum]
MSGGDDKKRVIKLLCPSLPKIVAIIAWEDQRLDLGFIARVFGLDPATIKLNGHFISRGVDLIASSVTWKSLLSFFSARGLAIGDSDSRALIVEGKLSKVGSKRTRSPIEVEKGVLCMKELNGEREEHLEDATSLSNKKFKERNRGVGLNLKRKLCLEDSGLLKRTRTNKCDSGMREREVDFQKAISDKPLVCSLASENLKRIRDDEMVVTASFKRIR